MTGKKNQMLTTILGLINKIKILFCKKSKYISVKMCHILHSMKKMKVSYFGV